MNRRGMMRRFAAGGTVATLGTLAGCQSLLAPDPPTGAIGSSTIPTDSWPMARHDPARSGAGTADISEPSTVANLTRSSDVAAAAPVIHDGHVYQTHLDYVAAYDSDGVERWQVKADGFFELSPAVVEDTVYVGGVDGRLLALDVEDGTQRWAHEVSGSVRSSPVVVGSTVFIATSARVHAVTTAGQERWRYNPSGDWPIHDVAYADETVYLAGGSGGPDGGGAIEALDAQTGTHQWRFDAIGENYMPPTVAPDIVIGGSADGIVYAIDRTDGTERWRVELPTQANAPPAVVDGTVYLAGNTNEQSVALDLADGTVRWRVRTGRLFAAPVATDDLVLFGWGYVGGTGESGPGVIGVNEDGVVEWRQRVPRPVDSLTVADGRIYAVGADPTGGALYVLK